MIDPLATFRDKIRAWENHKVDTPITGCGLARVEAISKHAATASIMCTEQTYNIGIQVYLVQRFAAEELYAQQAKPRLLVWR